MWTAEIIVNRRSVLDARGMLDWRSPAQDRIELRLLRDRRLEVSIASEYARSLPTHRRLRNPPIIEPGQYLMAYTLGVHGGREAFVHQGRAALRWRRVDADGALGPVESGWTGLNIHDWRGNSEGCVTVSAKWIARAVEAVRAVAQDWHPNQRHGDGRPLIDFVLTESAEAETSRCARIER